MNNSRSVRIFTMPQQFPCGPQSACCGPIGQSEEKIQSLKSTIERELNCSVEVKNVTLPEDMRAYPSIISLLQSLGLMALPIISLNSEVVSLGNPTPEQAVLAIQEKMNQV